MAFEMVMKQIRKQWILSHQYRSTAASGSSSQSMIAIALILPVSLSNTY
jgi:hypothetical protein